MPPLMPLLALLCAVAGVLCIFASTLFGVSHFADLLLGAAEGLFVLGVIVFTFYVLAGIIRDVRAA